MPVIGDQPTLTVNPRRFPNSHGYRCVLTPEVAHAPNAGSKYRWLGSTLTAVGQFRQAKIHLLDRYLTGGYIKHGASLQRTAGLSRALARRPNT